MRSHGHHSAYVLWTGERAARGIYKRLGFHVSRRFAILRLNLTTGWLSARGKPVVKNGKHGVGRHGQHRTARNMLHFQRLRSGRQYLAPTVQHRRYPHTIAYPAVTSLTGKTRALPQRGLGVLLPAACSS